MNANHGNGINIGSKGPTLTLDDKWNGDSRRCDPILITSCKFWELGSSKVVKALKETLISLDLIKGQISWDFQESLVGKQFVSVYRVAWWWMALHCHFMKWHKNFLLQNNFSRNDASNKRIQELRRFKFHTVQLLIHRES